MKHLDQKLNEARAYDLYLTNAKRDGLLFVNLSLSKGEPSKTFALKELLL
jgi:hypothetical protein